MNRQQQIDRFVAEAHVLAFSRLRDAPERIGEVRAQLARWRAMAGRARSDFYWNEWESLLAGSIDTLAEAICAPSDHAAALRSVSPMSVLISQAERAGLLRAARPDR
jgi:hypothetical protein